MENVRCNCGAMLLRADEIALRGTIEIKCRRCRTVNSIRPARPTPDRHERPRTRPE
ncbi:Com family DNA-binding transcriptional regulator [Methylobrevis pamukkalensis]|uniref:Com family DNA-binding transcriptional regulator n=1 Tax=Methylobrevis pamukkalensis TaxID=1439726 RepID=UPI00114CF879